MPRCPASPQALSGEPATTLPWLVPRRSSVTPDVDSVPCALQDVLGVGIATAATDVALAGTLARRRRTQGHDQGRHLRLGERPERVGHRDHRADRDQHDVTLCVTGLGAGMHMHHIRGVRGGHATCPTAALDTNGDGRVDLREGLPAYGPVA